MEDAETEIHANLGNLIPGKPLLNAAEKLQMTLTKFLNYLLFPLSSGFLHSLDLNFYILMFTVSEAIKHFEIIFCIHD